VIEINWSAGSGEDFGFIQCISIISLWTKPLFFVLKKKSCIPFSQR
jgi:hypothetical protein